MGRFKGALDMSMLKKSCGMSFLLFMVSGTAIASDERAAVGQVDGAAIGLEHALAVQDWKTGWYAARNGVIEFDRDLVFDPMSVIVKFEQGFDEDSRALIREVAGLHTLETWNLVPGLEHAAIDGTVEDAIAMIEALGLAYGGIEFVEPDYIVHTCITPNDTFYSLEWGMNNTGQTVNGDPGTNNDDIDAPQAWDVTTGSSTFVVADIDTGMRKTHEDLAPNIWTNPGEIAGNGVDDDGNGYKDDTWGWNFYSNNNNPNDDNGHGSHTAGTIGAKGNNAKGVAGVAWNCKLVALKFLGRTGSGSTSGAISAINYCVDKGIKVSNNSWGGPGSSSLQSAITSAQTAGHLLICAAGNSGVNIDTSPTYPASYTNSNIISVAAINNDFGLASFSNYGTTGVDLAAPGVMIASCYKSSDSSYVYLDGTSMATPHVTGVAALVWSVNPAWTYSQVKSKILSSVRTTPSLTGKCVTGGVLNANNAVH